MASSRWPVKLFNYLLLFLVAGIAAIALTTNFRQQPSFEPIDNNQMGGETTFHNRSSHAFGQPAPGLTPKEVALHAKGDVTFDAVFVTAPAKVNPGLGPLGGFSVVAWLRAAGRP